MPIESSILRHQPEHMDSCPVCGELPFRSFMRGQVQSSWRRLLGLRYCAVICSACKEIVAHERPEPILLLNKIEFMESELYHLRMSRDAANEALDKARQLLDSCR
jgi:hypothetical protein